MIGEVKLGTCVPYVRLNGGVSSALYFVRILKRP
jgi:hypothetical protein